jgi:hypothetical protein
VTDRRDHEPLEDRLEAFLAGIPDAVPDRVAQTAADRARTRRQRPAWLARVRQRSGFGGSVRGPVPVLAATVAIAIALIVLGAPLLGRPSTGPGSQPSASNGLASPAGSGAIASATPPPPTEPAETEPPATPAPSGPPALIDQVTRQIPLDVTPTAVGVAFDSLWVTNLDGDLLRIDPASGGVIATIPLGAAGCGPIQADPFALWLQTCSSDTIIGPEAASTIRVDPATNTVVRRFEDGLPDGVGIGTLRGLTWFVSAVGTPSALTAVATDTGEPVKTLEVGQAVLHLAAGFGSLWLTPIGEPAVIRLDPDTGEELARIALSGDSGYLATGGDAIWVAEPHQWLLGRIDPAASAVDHETGAAPIADQIVLDGLGRVWVLAHDVVLAYDATSGATLAQYAVPRHDNVVGIESPVLAADADGLWFGAPEALWFIPNGD